MGQASRIVGLAVSSALQIGLAGALFGLAIGAVAVLHRMGVAITGRALVVCGFMVFVPVGVLVSWATLRARERRRQRRMAQDAQRHEPDS